MFAARSTGLGGEPMVARWGSELPAVPLVVVLHGTGTSEHSMIEMSPWHGALPLDPPPPRGALRGMSVLLAHAEDGSFEV